MTCAIEQTLRNRAEADTRADRALTTGTGSRIRAAVKASVFRIPKRPRNVEFQRWLRPCTLWEDWPSELILVSCHRERLPGRRRLQMDAAILW